VVASVERQACVSRAAARRQRRVVAGGEGGQLMVRGRGVECVRIGRRAASDLCMGLAASRAPARAKYGQPTCIL
jgi:hypothetical protein